METNSTAKWGEGGGRKGGVGHNEREGGGRGQLGIRRGRRREVNDTRTSWKRRVGRTEERERRGKGSDIGRRGKMRGERRGEE